MAELTVSFVLYKTPAEEVMRAIEQVRASAPDAVVVLIDNSPEPNPLPATSMDGLTVLRPGRNLGYGVAHNLAFKLSEGGRYHAVLNTDLVYGPDVFPRLLEFMEAHDDVGLSMPRVIYPDGSIQHLCRLLPHPLDIFGRGFFPNAQWTKKRNDRYESRCWTYDRVAQFPFLSGCFMMIRRSVLDDVGTFDERFFMYGEDVDLSRRIHQKYKTMFVPFASIQHEYRSQAGGYRRKMSKIINLSRYFNKWGWWFDQKRDLLNNATATAIRDQV